MDISEYKKMYPIGWWYYNTVYSSDDNVFDITLNHKIDFPKIYSEFAIDRVYNTGNIRVKNINEMMVTISMIDILTNDILELCPKIKKYVIKSIEILMTIKNMTFAWRKNPEPNGKYQPNHSKSFTLPQVILFNLYN